MVFFTADDIVGFDDTVALDNITDRATFNSLSLEPGIWYFTIVRAYNKAGLYTTQSSDGFLWDNKLPIPGFVQDGIGKVISIRSVRDMSVHYCRWNWFYDVVNRLAPFGSLMTLVEVKGDI